MNNVLIIGNGFDLDLGLKTSYADFYNDDRWVMAHETTTFLSKMNQSSRYKVLYNNMDTTSLLSMLENNPVEEWNEMESIVEDFALACDREETPSGRIKAHLYELRTLSEKAREYIMTAGSALPKRESAAGRMLEAASRCESTAIYDFNLTDLKAIGEAMGLERVPDYSSVHGSVHTGAIIGAGNKAPLNGEYDVFKKMFGKGYRSRNISQAMAEARNIVVFGHSLSEQDSVYFKSFFMKASEEGNDMMKRITFVTRDDESRHSLIRNLEKLTDGRTADLFQNNVVRIFMTMDMDEKGYGELLDEISQGL